MTATLTVKLHIPGILTGTAVMTLSMILSACGTFVRDSAPDHYVDHTRVPDATPTVEPKSQYGNPDYYV